jgi:hypothetical protein
MMKGVLHEKSLVNVGRGCADGVAVRAGCHGTVLRRRWREHGEFHRHVHRYIYRYIYRHIYRHIYRYIHR